MGIDLGDVVVKRPVTFAEYAGKHVAFDAWNILYQFLASIRQPDGTPLMDKEGRVTSHLAGILYRTGNLVEAGIKPVFVFDGPPHPLKAETLAGRSMRKEQAERDLGEARTAIAAAREAGDDEAEAAGVERARTKAQQTSRLTVPMVEQAQEVLRALGIPVVQAPGEGEAQAAWMCQQGLVHAACSQDYDAVLFGTPRLVRHLAVTGRRKLPGKQVWVDVQPEEIALDASLASAGLTREQLIDVALLVGTDFHPGIHGIGPKKAVAVIKKEGNLESLIDRLAANPSSADSAVERAILEQHAALADRDEVRRIFLQPAHADPGAIDLKPADADAIHNIMVGRHGFSAERVDAALSKFNAARKKAGQTRLF
ncbi:MAG: flap endonuclease-1 [Candidatus Thermoplasmatota archaeon]